MVLARGGRLRYDGPSDGNRIDKGMRIIAHQPARLRMKTVPRVNYRLAGMEASLCLLV